MTYDHSTALRALLGATSDLMYFLDAGGRYQYVGTVAAEMLGLTPEEMIGRTAREVGMPADVAARFEARCAEVMRTGTPLRDESRYPTAHGTFVLDSVIAPVIDRTVLGVVVVARDVTARRRIEAHTRFVSELNQTLLPLTDADEIMALTARLLGEHLGVDRCAYADVEEDEDHFTITGDYTRDTFSIVGRYTLSSFGPAHEAALADKPYVVEDAETDPRMEPFREAYRQTGIAAVVQVTLKKRGRFVAGMAVHQKVPRRWTGDEIELVQTVVNRCWESLERARATRLLAESEERHRSLISILSSIVWTADAEGRMVDEQKSWQAYTGQTEEQYREFGWAAAVHPADIEKLMAAWQQAVATRAVYRSSGRLWHAATQQHRWFEVAAAPLLDAEGNLREWIGTVSDVHERRMAEEHVAEQRRWLQSVLDSLPVAVLFIEPVTGEVRFANRAASEIERAQLEVPAARLARGEPVEDLQLAAGVRTFLARGDRLPPLHGEPATGILALQDITALIAIEDELRHASRLKDEFLATLSHELRTPLTAIIGWATLLASEEVDAETLLGALRTIEQNAKAQARLIEDLVDVSRIVAGKLHVELHPIALAPVVRAAVESVRPTVDSKRIALALQLDERALVMGDASRLQQVVWNLLSNAVRFTPAGGTIDVRLVRRDPQLELTVSDNGEGIDPGFLPHVFDRFRQGDMSSTRPHGGLGLGLAIVRHLVEVHGGSVAAESGGPGTGATFRVRLPLPARTSDAVPAARAQQSRAELHGLSVLVVDDAPDAREMIRIMLERAGASVTTAASAAEATEAIARVRPDVLLSDIGMPDEDGNRMLRRLRAGGDRTPAIALTAYAGPDAAEAALASGYARHMAKPVDARELVAAVAEVARATR